LSSNALFLGFIFGTPRTLKSFEGSILELFGNLEICGTLKTYEGFFLKIIEILPINHSLHQFNAQFDAFASQGSQYFISEASRTLKTLFF
jgi:hypothetical protein